MGKVDRAKLYGYTKSVVEDEEGRTCDLSTLAADGSTLIGSGGTALAVFSPDGRWRDKSELTPVGLDGEEVEAVPSSLKSPIALKDKATVEDYLGHNIRMSYLLSAEDGLGAALEKELRAGTIYQFDFSYRGGISPDKGFLLADAEGAFWMMVGKPCEIEMVAQEATGAMVVDSEGGEGEVGDELLDFGMM
jgi:hypothetical protein